VSPSQDQAHLPLPSSFLCSECGGREAYRSRPRGFFERRILPIFLLQPARCEQCFHRAYIRKSVQVMERSEPSRFLQSQHGRGPAPPPRVA
jgi:hypothetical protein